MTKELFSKVQNLLTQKQKKIEQELQAVQEDDPVMSDGLAESTESGTESWRAEVHSKTLAVKGSLQSVLFKIKRALNNLKTGKYGKCEKCGKEIEPQRLKILPETTFCISCSKKYSR